MVATPRRLEKFESADTLISYTFPTKGGGVDPAAGLRLAYMPSIGSDGAYDSLRSAVAPLDVGTETYRGIITGADGPAIDTEIDNARSKLLRIGRGKLYTIDSAGVRRWAWARLAAMPSLRLDAGMHRHVPMILQFRRESTWRASALTSTSSAISATPQTVTVNNPGNMPVKLMVIRLRASTAGGIINPVITNLTNSYNFSTTRDSASVNSEIRVDTERLAVEYSNDDGASYADDFAFFTNGANQVNFMQLEPGDNSIRYTGGASPSLALEFSFYAVYA